MRASLIPRFLPRVCPQLQQSWWCQHLGLCCSKNLTHYWHSAGPASSSQLCQWKHVVSEVTVEEEERWKILLDKPAYWREISQDMYNHEHAVYCIFTSKHTLRAVPKCLHLSLCPSLPPSPVSGADMQHRFEFMLRCGLCLSSPRPTSQSTNAKTPGWLQLVLGNVVSLCSQEVSKVSW